MRPRDAWGARRSFPPNRRSLQLPSSDSDWTEDPQRTLESLWTTHSRSSFGPSCLSKLNAVNLTRALIRSGRRQSLPDQTIRPETELAPPEQREPLGRIFAGGSETNSPTGSLDQAFSLPWNGLNNSACWPLSTIRSGDG